jgi:hypothetical protein
MHLLGVVMKLTTLLGMGVAYVLGTKAGRERYEQMRSWVSTAGSSPAMDDAKQKVKEAGVAVAGQARDKTAEALSNAVSSALGRFGSQSDGESNRARSTSNPRKKETSDSRS